jgi:hypothetical protein
MPSLVVEKARSGAAPELAVLTSLQYLDADHAGDKPLVEFDQRAPLTQQRFPCIWLSLSWHFDWGRRRNLDWRFALGRRFFDEYRLRLDDLFDYRGCRATDPEQQYSDQTRAYNGEHKQGC